MNNFESGFSITALEIYHGILSNKEMSARSFFYFRDPQYLSTIPRNILEDFLTESPDSQLKLSALKHNIRAAYQKQNIHGHLIENYPCSFAGLKINWAIVKSKIIQSLSDEEVKTIEKVINQDNIILLEDFELLGDHIQKIIYQYSNVTLKDLESFGESVLTDLWESILEEYPDVNNESDKWENELFSQNLKRIELVEFFSGRNETLEKIEAYINGKETNKPLVLIGEKGIGLSSIIAESSIRRQKMSSDIVIARFSSTSEITSRIDLLLTSIIKELASVLEIELNSAGYDDFKYIKNTLYGILNLDKLDRKLIIFIDAIDKLDSGYNPQYLTWIPEVLNSNVRIILSASDNIVIESAKRLEFPMSQQS